MNQASQGAAPAKKKKKKPLRRAQGWGQRVLPMAGKLLMLAVAVAVMGLMFSVLQSIGSRIVRVALSVLIIFAMLAIHFGEGISRGVDDADASRTADKLLHGGHELTPQEKAACYHPMKALCAGLVVYALPLLLALALAATAEEYTYALQDLPTWLTQSYGTRADVMGPLGAYMRSAGITLVDGVRVFVRVLELVFINLFADPQTMTAMIDRLSPLFILSYPAAYVIGYLFGPRQSAKIASMNKRAKKVAVRRAQRSHLASELVGTGGEVHYGHRKDGEQKKKKELI
ncbi:MAG: hypothetical protein Q4G52_12430 [Clostridia bacterium]|nr:hypothetical protein [Clostridia bacterium]